VKVFGHWALAAGGLVLGTGILLTTPAWAAGRTMTMEATAYGPSAQDNYPYGATDYFGQPLTAGDVAVDPSVIPLKTCLYITGYNSPNLPPGGFIGEADDEGDAIVGYHVDLFMNAPESQVNAFGIQTVKVTILGPLTNPQASGTAACAGYASSIQGGSASSGSGSNTASVSTAQNPASRVGSSSDRTAQSAYHRDFRWWMRYRWARSAWGGGLRDYGSFHRLNG
jgi:3D (Asp-Asp-Asp) domain-containing protein